MQLNSKPKWAARPPISMCFKKSMASRQHDEECQDTHREEDWRQEWEDTHGQEYVGHHEWPTNLSANKWEIKAGTKQAETSGRQVGGQAGASAKSCSQRQPQRNGKQSVGASAQSCGPRRQQRMHGTNQRQEGDKWETSVRSSGNKFETSAKTWAQSDRSVLETSWRPLAWETRRQEVGDKWDNKQETSGRSANHAGRSAPSVWEANIHPGTQARRRKQNNGPRHATVQRV